MNGVNSSKSSRPHPLVIGIQFLFVHSLSAIRAVQRVSKNAKEFNSRQRRVTAAASAFPIVYMSHANNNVVKVDSEYLSICSDRHYIREQSADDKHSTLSCCKWCIEWWQRIQLHRLKIPRNVNPQNQSAMSSLSWKLFTFSIFSYRPLYFDSDDSRWRLDE